jgi:hypothetical protein
MIQLMSVLAVILCFFPLIIYSWKRLVTNKAYMVIAIFWTINGILYIPEVFHWQWYYAVSDQILLYYNLFEAPIIFLTFYYASGRKIFLYMILVFAVFDTIMIEWKGLNFGSGNIIVGMGSLVCLIVNVWGIINFFKKVEHTDGETALVFIYAGFVFYFGLFAIIYPYSYILESVKEKPYIHLINFMSVCLATGLISYGLWKFAHTEYLEEKY